MRESSSDSQEQYEVLSASISQQQLLKCYKQNYEMYLKKNKELKAELKQVQKELEIKVAENRELKEQKLSLSIKADNYQEQLKQMRSMLRKLEQKEEKGDKKRVSEGVRSVSDQSLIQEKKDLINQLLSNSLYLSSFGVEEGDALKAYSRVLSKQNNALKTQIQSFHTEKQILKNEAAQIFKSKDWSQKQIKSETGRQILAPFVNKLNEKLEKEREDNQKRQQNMTIEIELMQRKLRDKEREMTQEIQIKERELRERQSEEIVSMNKFKSISAKQVLMELEEKLEKLVKGHIFDQKFEGVIEVFRKMVDEDVRKKEEEMEEMEEINEQMQAQMEEMEEINRQMQAQIQAYNRGISQLINNMQNIQKGCTFVSTQRPEIEQLGLSILQAFLKQKRFWLNQQQLQLQKSQQLIIELKSKQEQLATIKEKTSEQIKINSQLQSKLNETQKNLEQLKKQYHFILEKCKQLETQNLAYKNQLHAKKEQLQTDACIPEEVSVTLPQIFEFLQEYIKALEMPIDKIRAKNKIAWFVTEAIQI